MTKLVVLMLALSCWAGAQAESYKTYASETLGFRLNYPAIFEPQDMPCHLAQWLSTFGGQSVLYVGMDSSPDSGSILVTLDRRKFQRETLERTYAHTGWDEPIAMPIGDSVFYYYGVGGGAVAYTDDYLYDLDGNILLISFNGPRLPTEKSPTEEFKKLERRVLESFRRIANKDTR